MRPGRVVLPASSRTALQLLFVLALCLCWQTEAAFAADLPTVTHYALDLRLFPKQGRLEADARITIFNSTGEAHTRISFLLYRLLEVRAVSDAKGAPLQFSQSVLKVAEIENLQANLVQVSLAEPLRPGTSTQVAVQYAGGIFGYAEVWAYVKDRIGEQYSLLRPDALAYPMLAAATGTSLRAAYRAQFTFDVQVTAPADYVVAGGQLKERRAGGETSTFVFQNRVPTWRMDIAAAKFKLLQDALTKLAVYVLPEDEAGGAAVLDGMKRAIALYTARFGAVKDFQGYTAIEIPDGWGSQAGAGYILQTAAAFKNTENLGEVYHEIAHTWNVKPKEEVQHCRWFDEGFASYFQALAVREFKGEQAFTAEMERSRESFARRAKADPKNAETPIANYGKFELGGNSYSKGAWSLYVLHELVGEDAFNRIVRTLLADFSARPADFKDFQKTAERVTQRDLRRFFDEWIFGAESSRLLLEKISIAEMVQRYR